MLQAIKDRLIVSCQAFEDEPLHSPMIMSKMALAAMEGGAGGIRANSHDDIVAIKQEVPLPVIGVVKRNYPDSPVHITPTLREVSELVSAGTDIIALDATYRPRPSKIELEIFVQSIRLHFPEQLLMGDISTLSEAIEAERMGFDCISTKLVGCTPYSSGKSVHDDNYKFLHNLVSTVKIPVIAEGNILTPVMAKRCLEAGAHSVVVGDAITRPQQITRRFAESMKA